MNFSHSLSSDRAVILAMFLGKVIPPRMGRYLSDHSARIFSSLPVLQLNKSIRANQWVVHQCDLEREELDRIAFLTFQSIGDCIYDYYHYRSSFEKVQQLINIPPHTHAVMRDIRNGKSMIIAVLHTSNYEMGIHRFCQSSDDILILSIPKPHEGYQFQNKLRLKAGLKITPISVSSFLQAKRHLLQGGSVLTGIDRPGTNTKYRPRFFGHASALPIGYIRLALLTHVPIVVMSCITNPNRTYTLMCSEAIHLKPGLDLHEEIVENAESVLQIAEGFIRKNPCQWSMAYPVWPDIQPTC